MTTINYIKEIESSAFSGRGKEYVSLGIYIYKRISFYEADFTYAYKGVCIKKLFGDDKYYVQIQNTEQNPCLPEPLTVLKPFRECNWEVQYCLYNLKQDNLLKQYLMGACFDDIKLY